MGSEEEKSKLKNEEKLKNGREKNDKLDSEKTIAVWKGEWGLERS